MPELLDPTQVLDRIPQGARIVTSQCCGQPTTLLRVLDSVETGREIALLSGLLIEYPFITAVAEGRLAYSTWSPTPAIAQLIAQAIIGYRPLRWGDVPVFLTSIEPDVAFVRVGRPDEDGYYSFGPSTSYARAAVSASGIVIGEVDPDLPRTNGWSTLHESELDYVVETAEPMAEYETQEGDATTDLVVRNLMDLLPGNPVLQLGIGSVPETFARALAKESATGVRLLGMVTDASVDLFEADVLSREPLPSIMAVELMGTRRLMDFAHRNDLIHMYPSSVAHDPRFVGELSNVVSINSALEVDLYGGVSSESLGPWQMSGVGGSFDYVEGARRSSGGMHIIALPSTARGAEKSRIVPRGAMRGPTTVPHHTVDWIVTEFGAASLRNLTAAERMGELIQIAHPRFRADLSRDLATTQTVDEWR